MNPERKKFLDGKIREARRVFKTPPGVTSDKQVLDGGMIMYTFRHRTLGQLGRVAIRDSGKGQTHLSYELSGEPTDPMTKQRAALLKLVCDGISQTLEIAFGKADPSTPCELPPPLSSQEPTEVVASKVFLCDKCDGTVAMLINAPEATDPGRFEDYARKMYQKIMDFNVPTWIIGPDPGPGPNDSAELFKVWPEREPIRKISPSEFKRILDGLKNNHCSTRRRTVRTGPLGTFVTPAAS